MDDYSDYELDELRRRVEDLQRQNQILKLESEISGFQRDIGDASALASMSTPMTGKSEMSAGPGKLRFCIPPGRSEDGTKSDKAKDESKLLDDQEPDRYVTYRKSKIGPKDMTGKVMMKPATFDGTVAWMDYKAHFDACSELNGWTDEQKGLYLSVSLRGQAQGVFGNLGSGKPSYKDLVTALEERFAPPNQTELYRVQL